jgi:hypothetical protein
MMKTVFLYLADIPEEASGVRPGLQGHRRKMLVVLLCRFSETNDEEVKMRTKRAKGTTSRGCRPCDPPHLRQLSGIVADSKTYALY